MTTPQHDDPFGEATAKVLQALAVLTTVGESVARFAAAGAQSRAAKAEQRANLERAADAARQQADRAAQQAQRRADRQFMDLAFDDAWLGKADIESVAKLWRTAAMYGLSGDRRAAEVMRRAQERLAILNPGLIEAYNRHRAAGMPIAEAMKAATREVWQHQTRPSTPQPTQPGNATPADHPSPTGKPPVDDLDTAAQAEVRRLAEGIDLDILDQLERQWRGTHKVPAAEAAARLAEAIRMVRAEKVLGGPATAAAPRTRTDAARPQPSVDETPMASSPLDRTSPGTNMAPQPADDDAFRAGQADEVHLTVRADQQLRRAAADRAQPDLLATRADERTDGLTAGHTRHGRAEHDQAAAAQRRRFGQTFPPLTRLTPTFSHPPAQPPASPATTRRRGSTR